MRATEEPRLYPSPRLLRSLVQCLVVRGGNAESGEAVAMRLHIQCYAASANPGVHAALANYVVAMRLHIQCYAASVNPGVHAALTN